MPNNELFQNLTNPTTSEPAKTQTPVAASQEAPKQEPVQKQAEAPKVTQQAPVAPKMTIAPVIEDTESEDDLKVDELMLLKGRASMMGISYSGSDINELKTIIDNKLKGNGIESEDIQDEEVIEPKQKTKSIRQYMIDTQLKLVRLRIMNLDPKKKDLPGEILTVANEYLGTVRKFVPYGEVTENGYHVPYCLYQMMKDRKFTNIRVRKQNGREIVEANDVPEFSLEVLPQLTHEELAKLAAAQQAKGGVGDI